MPNLIQVKRGNKTSIPILKPGEPGFCLDSKDFYVGDGTTNTRFVKESEVVRASSTEATTATDTYKIMTPKTVKDAFNSYGKAEVSTALASAKTYTDTKVAALVNGAPGVLDTLKELSDALGGDANFATTVMTKIDGKADKSHGNHVPAIETASNSKFLRNDNTWQTVTPSNIGAIAPTGTIVANRIAVFNDTTGKVIKDSGYTIATSVPSGSIFTDYRVTNTLATTTKAYLTGTTSATTTTGTQVFDTGVYLDTTAGKLVAVNFTGALTGNASTATTLQTARTINGTSFNGSANITTANWGTARTLTIGNTGKSVNGSANVAWTLAEIGAAASSHNHTSLTGVTSIKFAANSSDSASITTTISDSITYMDFNLSDDFGQETWRWRFTPNGGTVYNAMELKPTAQGSATLLVGGKTVSTTDHTHSYAGSSSVGGSANSAVKLATARTLTVGNTGKAFDGTANVSWSLSEIGAAASSHTHSYLPLSGGTLTGALTLSGNPTSNLHAATKQYVDSILGSNDAMVFKGTISASANPNFPAANCGDTYKISTAGRVGGSSGVKVEIGDMVICLKDSSAAGDNATVGANWNVIQANIDGAVTGPTSSVDNRIATFSGTGGKVIKDSGYTIATSVPSGAKFTDTTYSAGTGLALSGTTFNHSTSVTAGTAQGDASKTLTFGGTFLVPTVTYNAQGHVTGKGTTTMTMPAAPTSVSGNAGTATKLQTPRAINGTNFDGSAAITTANWGTARTITVGNSAKSVNGSGNVSYSLSEIGALPVAGGTVTGNLAVNGTVTVGQKVTMQYNTTTESLDFIFS